MCSLLLLGFGWSLMELDTDRVVAKHKQQECLHCKFSNVRQITLKKFSHTFHKKLNIFIERKWIGGESTKVLSCGFASPQLIM